jgi:hypothetical protein
MHCSIIFILLHLSVPTFSLLSGRVGLRWSTGIQRQRRQAFFSQPKDGSKDKGEKPITVDVSDLNIMMSDLRKPLSEYGIEVRLLPI